MTEQEDEFFSDDDKRRERLARTPMVGAGYNPRYSTFIRWMKLALPMVALVLTAVVFAWSNMSDENIIPTQDPAHAPKTIGKNELLNPRFESMDDKKQPYTITAKRALQGNKNEDLVMLEEPLADMLLNSGNWVAIEAEEGAFRQDNQKLLLRGHVRLFHDRGYQLEMAELHIDMESSTAWSETDISGQGPAGTLKAKGLQADSKEGHLVFNGPAVLVLNRSVSDLSMEGKSDE